jgi:hypothetical protein
MTAISITPGYPTFADTDGSPLNDGYVYIGLENQDPITAPTGAFWDKEFQVPADQPLRTSGGYIVRNGTPAAVYTGASYSILVQNKNLVTVYNAPSAVITNVTNNVEEITQYQGAHATDPIARNDGTPLEVGDLYFNTVINELKVWTGTDWVPASPGAITVQNFTGTGAQTGFNLASAPVSENNTQIYIDGVYQQKDTYTVAGATINFSTAPPYLSGIEVVTFSIAALGTVDASNVSYNEGSLGAVNTSVQAKLQESVSVKDFGAVGDYNTATSVGTANYTAFINASASTSDVIHIPSGNYFNGGTGGATEAYTGNGIVYSGVGSALNFKYQPIGNVGGARGKNHFSIGAIPRCTAGVFSLLDDANHTPMNVASISQPDAYSIRLTYSSPASKINSFVVGPDDALTLFGVVCGGDVGATYANIITAAPFSYEIQKSGGTPSLLLNDLWAGGISGGNISVTASDASIVRVTHTPAVSNDPPLVSLNVSNLALYPVVSFYDQSTIDIMMTGDASGYLSYSGSAWSQTLSDNLTDPTLTWTASNTLKVDHGISGSTNRTALLTGHGGTYIPFIVNKGATFFEIAFYDYSGTKITTQDTNMTVWYKLDVRVPCTWADGVDVVVRRGHIKVPSALYSGVSGNNFWVSGDMEF